MPGCSSPPVISASMRNRCRLVGSSAWWSRICLSATSRFSSLIQRDEHRPQPAAGVRPEDAEPLAVAGRRADGVGCRAVGIAVLGRAVRRRPTWPSVASMSGSPSRARLSRVDLPAGTAARLFSTSPPCCFQVDVDQRLQQRRLGVGQVAPGFEVVGQALGLVERPGLEGGDELALVDEAVLKREQSEQEMAVGGGGHGMAPIVVGRRDAQLLTGSHGPRFRGRPARSPSRETTLAAPVPDRFFSSCPS